jgi:hypothetical protein
MPQFAVTGESYSNREECNKYDLTTDQWFWLAPIIVMLRPGGLLLVVLHLSRFSVLWVGLQKSKLLNLDVKNIFARVTYWAPLEMLYI